MGMLKSKKPSGDKPCGAINHSGLLPVEYKILVKLDSVDEKTPGGIIIPIALVEKEKMMQEQATLIAAGGNAFEDFKGDVPKVGDRVYVAKHAGYKVTGKDKEKYQLMNDKDIAAIIGG